MITGFEKFMISHFHAELIISMSTLEHSKHTQWLSNNYIAYILLEPSASAQELEAKFPGMIEIFCVLNFLISLLGI